MVLALALLVAASPNLALCKSNDVRPKSAWTEVAHAGTGAVAEASAGDGKATLVLFGGYTARPNWVQVWAEAVAKGSAGASDLASIRFGKLIAVPGPSTAGFTGGEKEIPLTALVKHLEGLSPAPALLVFAAHSSGAAVAARTLAKVSPGLAKRIMLIRLDGGDGAPRSDLGGWACASAKCTSVKSHNAEAMVSSCGRHAFTTTRGAGDPKDTCKASWCCHDFVVNKAPFDPNAYCLGLDYTAFDAQHPVNLDWLRNPTALEAMKKLAH